MRNPSQWSILRRGLVAEIWERVSFMCLSYWSSCESTPGHKFDAGLLLRGRITWVIVRVLRNTRRAAGCAQH